MKIALCTLAFPDFTVSLARALQPHCEIEVFIPDSSVLAEDNYSNIRTFSYRADSSPIAKLRGCHALMSEIASLQPDLVHFQGSSPYLIPFLPLLRNFAFIYSLHDPVAHSGEQRLSHHLSEVFFTKLAKRVIVLAEAMREPVGLHFPWTKDKLAVVPHGIFDCYTDGPQTRPHWLPEDSRFVLFFGRVSPYKGVEDLLEAFRLVAPRVGEKLVIAGRQLYPIVIPTELKANVIVADEYVSNDVLRHLFRNCSLIVLPYRDATQSGVLMLAYAFGSPVISTNVGGFREMVRDGETGIVVQPECPAQLAEAILDCLADPPRTERMGRNGKQWAEVTFSWKEIAGKTFGIYETSLSGLGSKPARVQLNEFGSPL